MGIFFNDLAATSLKSCLGLGEDLICPYIYMYIYTYIVLQIPSHMVFGALGYIHIQ